MDITRLPQSRKLSRAARPAAGFRNFLSNKRAAVYMPGAVAGTSTYALTNETPPYVLEPADKGLPQAMRGDPALGGGLNVAKGEVVLQTIADQSDLPYTPVEEVVQ